MDRAMEIDKKEEEQPEVIRGTIGGRAKYCRIPIRAKTAELMQESGIAELTAEKILEMPHDTAVKTIDAIMYDWKYWLGRANELFVLWAGRQGEDPPGVVHKPS